MRRGRIWWSRGLGVVLLVPLLLWLGGCWLFNVAPIASFTVSAELIVAGGTIQFNAVRSSDEDGEIVSYVWDFDDGTDGSGMTVSHTFATVGTYSIYLRVTDDKGDFGETRKTIYVEAAAPAGPTASFTATPTSGTSPLAVTFNATASTSPEGALTYAWTFGDGQVGTGQVTTHTYFSGTARTFTATLTVTAADGRTATATASITVTVPGGGGGTPTGTPPSARFDILNNPLLAGGPAGSIGVAPYRGFFDPANTIVAIGKTLAQLIWSFGDGGSATTPNLVVQDHTYVTADPSEVFSIMLFVLDNEADSNSITKTVRVYNHQPVAGFEIANPDGGHTIADDDEEYATEALARAVGLLAPVPTGRWDDDDANDGVVMGDIQKLGPVGGPWPVNVWIRSRLTTDAADWYTLLTNADQDKLTMAEGVLAAPGTTPGVPDDYTGAVATANQFSYDPEGQYWAGGVFPVWFPNQAWGIQWIYVNWGDGGPEQQFDYAVLCNDPLFPLVLYDQDAVMGHVYNLTGLPDQATITIRVVDFLGGEASLSRTVHFQEGTEALDDL
ncbi:PKD domain-containing protein [Candidatus Bipolaricaulota bacterium]